MRLPRLRSRQVIKALKRGGFYEVRQTGSHLVLVNERIKKIIPVPVHTKELKHGLVVAIIKEAGLTTKEFLKLLH